MKKAIVSEELQEHFWLAIKDWYSWFTSPIRRYADLQIHRIIWEIEEWIFNDERREHYNQIVWKVALKCSIQEDKAESIEKQVNYFHAVKYMEDKVWKEFDWFVTSISKDCVSVELENTISWELKLPVDTKLNEIFEGFYEVVLWEDWETILPWDELRVKVTEVDTNDLNIYFDIISVKV